MHDLAADQLPPTPFGAFHHPSGPLGRHDFDGDRGARDIFARRVARAPRDGGVPLVEIAPEAPARFVWSGGAGWRVHDHAGSLVSAYGHDSVGRGRRVI